MARIRASSIVHDQIDYPGYKYVGLVLNYPRYKHIYYLRDLQRHIGCERIYISGSSDYTVHAVIRCLRYASRYTLTGVGLW